jgi:hypothetical protein
MKATKKAAADEKPIRFYRLSRDEKAAGCINCADDERLSLMAACIKAQQDAGFRELIDIRQAECPKCQAPGFNTGWGYLAYTCGAELTGGTDFNPCTPKRRKAARTVEGMKP